MHLSKKLLTRVTSIEHQFNALGSMKLKSRHLQDLSRGVRLLSHLLSTSMSKEQWWQSQPWLTWQDLFLRQDVRRRWSSSVTYYAINLTPFSGFDIGLLDHYFQETIDRVTPGFENDIDFFHWLVSKDTLLKERFLVILYFELTMMLLRDRQ
jgi:hypothetical protein